MLVRFGQGLGNFVIRRVTGWNWLAQASPWVGLIAGATIGGAVYVRIGETAVWLPIALASLLAAGSAVMRQPDWRPSKAIFKHSGPTWKSPRTIAFVARSRRDEQPLVRRRPGISTLFVPPQELARRPRRHPAPSGEIRYVDQGCNVNFLCKYPFPADDR